MKIQVANLSEPIAPINEQLAAGARCPEALEYPHPQVPSDGVPQQVAEDVYWLRAPLPFALDHINLWLIRDDEGWTTVDTGYGSDAAKAAWEQAFQGLMKGQPLNRVLATHYHPDHVGLAGWLTERFGVELWMTEAEFLAAHHAREGTAGYGIERLLELFARHGLGEQDLQEIGARGNGYRRGTVPLPVSFRRLMHGDSFHMGGRRWEVLAGYGHSPEHAAYFCPELKVLISGDMILPRISPNIGVWPSDPNGDPLGRYLESLKRFERLPADTLVLPSHGKPFRGLHQRLRELAEHHAERLTAFAGACETPRTAADLVPEMFRPGLDAHQLFCAMGESVAHLNYMLHRGQLRRLQDPAETYSFVA